MGDYHLSGTAFQSAQGPRLRNKKYGGKMGEENAGVPRKESEIARRGGCTKALLTTDLRLQ